MLNLGELTTVLRADYSELVVAEGRARQFSDKVTKQFSRLDEFAQKTSAAGEKLSLGVTTPLLAAAGASAKMAIDFNKNIREVNSLLDESSRDFSGLKKDVQGVATLLGLDLTSAAGAAYQAISASVPRENLVTFLEVAGKSAIAGVTNIETAVDGLTTVTNAWKDSAGSTQQISDVMFTAVKRGKTTFEELSKAMFQAAGIAPELGVDFKEVAAATATMTKQGIPTSVAMTQMRQAMVALAKPNADMAALLEKAGIKSVKASIGTLGLAGTYDKLRKAAEGSQLEESVGSVEALGFVLSTTGKNAKSFREDLTAMQNGAGAAGSAFEEMDKARSFERLTNTLRSVAVTIGDALLPIIIPLATEFANWLGKINELDPGLVQIGVTVGAVVAAIGPLLIAVGILMGFIAPMITSAGGFAGALSAIAAAAGPVGLAIALIAAGGILLYQNWEAVKTLIITMVNDIITWFQEWVSQNSTLIDSITEKWNALVASGKALWDSLLGAITSFVSSSIEWLNKLLEPIGGLKGAWEILKDAIGQYLVFIGKQLVVLLDAIKSIFDIVKGILDGNIGTWEGLGKIVGTVIGAIIKLGANMLSEMKKAFEGIAAAVKAIDWIGLGKQIVDGLIVGIKNSPGAVKDAVVGVVSNAYDGAKDFLGIKSPSRLFKALGKFISQGMQVGIDEKAPDAIAAAVRLADGVHGSVKDRFKDLQLDLTLGGGFGGSQNDITSQYNKFDSEIEKEQAYQAQSLELLQQAEQQKLDSIVPYQRLREQMQVQHENKLAAIEQDRMNFVLDTTSSFFGSLTALQSSQSKKAQSIGKAAAIAQATIDTYKAATGAYAAMASIPYVGPALGAAAAGAAIAAGFANISAIRSAKATGGNVFGGGVYRVNENGPEMFSDSRGDFLMMGSGNGKVTPFGKYGMNGGGSGGTNVYVKVENNAGVDVRVEEGGTDKEKEIKIIIERTKKSLTADVYRKGNEFSDALDTQFQERKAT